MLDSTSSECAMNFKVIGIEALMKKLKRLSAPELTSELQKTTLKAVNYVHSQVPAYPSAPAGSSYARTGTLGREINTEVKTMGTDVVGIIGSPTPYAPWVISDEAAGSVGPQAWMHKGRWWVLQGVVRKAQDNINKFFDDMMRRLTS